MWYGKDAVDPYLRFAETSGAVDPGACARAARALFAERLPAASIDAAVYSKKILARGGFVDHPEVFTLPDMLAHRAGNCLGLTLLIGAALLDHGHDVGFVLRVNPLDDVHDAGVEHFARLCGADEGVDEDSRLPEADDRSSRFRFVPLEHAALALPAERDRRPFEATGLANAGGDSLWAPEAESVRAIGFADLAAMVLSERAKAVVRAGGPTRAALALALRAVRAWPQNREAWADVWSLARRLGGRAPLVAHAEAEYGRARGDDSLFWFTRYRMTGEETLLDRALERLPAYAEAYVERHVTLPLSRGARDADLGAIRRHLAVAAWMVAESEVLDLEGFYRGHADAVRRAFSPRELDEVLASFDEAGLAPRGSRR
jgi:hypothetical protein